MAGAAHGGERRAGDVQGRLDRAQAGAGRRTPRVRRRRVEAARRRGRAHRAGERLDGTQRAAPGRIKLQLALAQLEQQQQAAEALRRETQDQSLRDNVTGLYQKVHRGSLRREVDLSSREHREFAGLDRARCTRPKRRPWAWLHARASSKRWAGCCAAIRGRWTPRAGSTTATSRCCSPAWAWPRRIRAWKALRRQCATQIVVLEGRNLGFTVSMGVASFPHTAHTQEALLQAAETALTEARKRWRKPRHAGQHPLRAGVSLGRGSPPSAGQPLVHHAPCRPPVHRAKANTRLSWATSRLCATRAPQRRRAHARDRDASSAGR